MPAGYPAVRRALQRAACPRGTFEAGEGALETIYSNSSHTSCMAISVDLLKIDSHPNLRRRWYWGSVVTANSPMSLQQHQVWATLADEEDTGGHPRSHSNPLQSRDYSDTSQVPAQGAGGSAQCQGNRKGLSGSALSPSLHPFSLKAQAQFFRGCQAHK